MIGFPAIFLLALVVRLVWVVLFDVIPVSDGQAYMIYATNIVEHGVYGLSPDQPGAYWAVGAAAVYAGSFLVFGIGPLGVILPNLISSMLAVWGLWDLGRRWFGETEGRIAAFVFALWPLAIQFTTVLASELHFMALTLLGLMAWDRARHFASVPFWLWSLAAGFAFAGATYMRPIALLVPGLLALAVLLQAPKSSFSSIAKACVVTVVIFAVVAPWSARNERVFGEPVFMSTNFWANFWMGNHPGTDGGYKQLPPETDTMGEIERSAYLEELSKGHLRDDPFGLVIRTGWKALKLHQRETIGVGWNSTVLRGYVGDTGVTVAKGLSTLWWYAMLLAAFWGIVTLFRRSGLWATLLIPPVWLWGYYTGVHAVIVVGDRYHMPAIPMIALLAAVGIAAFRSTRAPQPHR